jgi:hypothetical protein
MLQFQWTVWEPVVHHVRLGQTLSGPPGPMIQAGADNHLEDHPTHPPLPSSSPPFLLPHPKKSTDTYSAGRYHLDFPSFDPLYSYPRSLGTSPHLIVQRQIVLAY